MLKIKFERIEAALSDDESVGFCLDCGTDNYGVEPDARKYLCEECGKHCVYGASEIVIMGQVDTEE